MSSSHTSRRAKLLAIALPSDHSTWIFLLTPFLLGIALAPSVAGVLLGVAALSAFLVRQPLELMLSDLQHGRPDAETRTAAQIAGLFAVSAAVSLAWALIVAVHLFWPFLVVAAVLAAVQLFITLRRQRRIIFAQIAGAAALNSLAPAIALAGGWNLGDAVLLWALLLAWAIPTAIYVRVRLRRSRGEAIPVLSAVDAHVAGLTFVVALALAQHTSAWMVVPLALMLARAAYGLRPSARRTHPWLIGLQEVAFSLMLVVGLTFAYWVS